MDLEAISAEPAVREVVASIRDSILETAASSVVGLYLYGSLVAGDFDDQVSDIDLIAVLADDPDDELATDLEKMHGLLAREHPEWAGRIEVVYVSAAALQGYRDESPRMAVISPGEPFHVVAAGPEWVLSWFPARDEATALFGPPVSAVIPHIPEQEFLNTVRRHLRGFNTAIENDSTLGSCAYVIITFCRGLYTLRFGKRPSKATAARWAADEFPEWRRLIDSALVWRKEQWTSPTIDQTAIAKARRFVSDMTRRLEA